MSHKKSDRQVWQVRFNLSSDNPDDVRLHEYLQSLVESGEAATWMRTNLTTLVPPKYNGSTPVVPPKMPKKLPDKVTIEHKGTEHMDVTKVKVEKLQSQGSHPIPSNLTPTEIIRQRKAEARAKFSTPVSKPKETP